jgi:serine/threonine protein kinase
VNGHARVCSYCAVGSVISLLDVTGTPLSEAQIAFILWSTLNALVYLNVQKKIIHRDVKARNILLTADGDVRLADFGVSSVLKRKAHAHARAHTRIAHEPSA